MTEWAGVENAADLGGTPARETAIACVEAGIEAAHPRNVITSTVTRDGTDLQIGGETYDLSAYEEVVVLGGGKAAAQVAAELETILGNHLSSGVVVTNDPTETATVNIREGAHPVPDENGVAGAREVLDQAAAADERSLILAVVTGGGSALLPAPADGVTLDDLQRVTDSLVDSGASIHEINAVRKHCSAIKGGGLALASDPATVVTLAFSDVVGVDLDVIASGPTVPDSSTYTDAIEVLDRYEIEAPAAIRQYLERGVDGVVAETPGADHPAFDGNDEHVLATNLTALRAAKTAAVERGYEGLVLSSRIRGEARDAAQTHVAIAEECLASGNPLEPPAVLVSGGEATVTVEGSGRGGPNQEFALAAGIEVPARATVAAVDTDGEDGGTPAAGALVDAGTVDDRSAAQAALSANDAFGYLESRKALLSTGRTGTNVNDLRVLVVEN